MLVFSRTVCADVYDFDDLFVSDSAHVFGVFDGKGKTGRAVEIARDTTREWADDLEKRALD